MRYGNARASTRPESTVVTGCEEQTLEMAISVNSNRRPRAARFLGRSGLGLRSGPLIIAVQSRQAQRWRGPAGSEQDVCNEPRRRRLEPVHEYRARIP